ncbi:hypothetical protein ACFOPQ_02015 [Deinococcus antarcticus]|uniref:DUF4145 domain-containing protein n=1 Tax=Deinococcus antarcticus TaxID=1298767 RepID=A0ABV8A5V4_9DEIO
MTTTDSLRIVRDRAVALERQLDSIGAVGNGLGEKYRNLDLPAAVQEDLRQVVHLRNRVMHDGIDLSPADLARFEQAADRAMTALSGRPGGRGATSADQSSGCGATLVALVVIVGAAWFLTAVIHHPLVDALIWFLVLLMVWGAVTSKGKK